METIYTVDHTRLNKNEIDILCDLGGSVGEQGDHSITEISHQTNLFVQDVMASVEHLILEGLLEWTDKPEIVRIPVSAYDWLDEHCDTLAALATMNDCNLFTDEETATS